jgi:hypothetical protein
MLHLIRNFILIVFILKRGKIAPPMEVTVGGRKGAGRAVTIQSACLAAALAALSDFPFQPDSLKKIFA